jgi:adenine phosphoribosyltransferase
MEIVQRIKDTVRDVPDFPKPGILFKDITPILSDPELSRDVSHALSSRWDSSKVDAIVGVESRGFIYGMQMAQLMNVPFVPVRKAGKLPYNTIRHSYELEYGSAEVEMHIDAIGKGHNVLVHDDLLATGGTAGAAAELIIKSGGTVAGFSFLIELSFLHGRKAVQGYSDNIHSLVKY